MSDDTIASTIADAIDERLAERFAALEARIIELMSEKPAGERRLTRAELAAAWQVSIRHVDALRARGLPCILIGESPRFDQRLCEAWLSEQAEVAHAAE